MFYIHWVFELNLGFTIVHLLSILMFYLGLAGAAVLGDGFMASGLTIQNTVGPNAHQAVAFKIKQ